MKIILKDGELFHATEAVFSNDGRLVTFLVDGKPRSEWVEDIKQMYDAQVWDDMQSQS